MMQDFLNQFEQSVPLWATGLGSLFIGLVLGWFLYKLYRVGMAKNAQIEAEEILQEVKDAAELRLLDEKERTQELETELWGKVDKDHLAAEERIEEMDELTQEKKQKLDNLYSQARQKALTIETEVVAEEKRIEALDQNLRCKKVEVDGLRQEIVKSLLNRLQVKKEEVQAQIIADLEQETRQRAQTIAEAIEEDHKEHAETKAKAILETVLNRFARAYSSERGIAAVYFEFPEQRKILVDEKGENIKLLQSLTGCDIFVAEDMDLVGVAGFDPVRREFTRRLLERCLKEKKPIQLDFIKRTAENMKRDLFGQIKRDGDQITKELGLHGINAEVRQMMGSLRYRYSFTQNQYFHCAEVGWLCGLLASELRTVPTMKGRRAGMLHDLGKAMDHELDGGHAMIGADFIQTRGEAADIVHAVRAHHYDEQPSSDLAFLVIAADAISGARPGARRSTIESYNQKVTELESIARSFDGVTDCYILSGGRECRVITNGKQVDDLRALKLSAEIAKRIEAECQYPGHIKVVVVRSTLAVETTR
jgi:ribonuclease Y